MASSLSGHGARHHQRHVRSVARRHRSGEDRQLGAHPGRRRARQPVAGQRFFFYFCELSVWVFFFGVATFSSLASRSLLLRGGRADVVGLGQDARGDGGQVHVAGRRAARAVALELGGARPGRPPRRLGRRINDAPLVFFPTFASASANNKN